MLQLYEYLLLLSPLLLGFLTSSVCPMDSDSGSILKFRPPSYVFGIGWFILYILLGMSWVLAQRKYKFANYLYMALNILLCLWIVVFSCYKSQKNAVFVLIACVALAFMCFTSGVLYSQLLICPLLAWLIFALIMNTTLVQDSN